MAHPNHDGDRNSETWRRRIADRQRRGGLSTIGAGRARQRLNTLSSLGVGRKAVHEVTGINESTLRRIKNGKTKYVRKETAELIFSVPFNAFCDGAYVDASETWRLIRRMTTQQDMGFTQAEIARRLGTKGTCPELQIGRLKTRARIVMKVEKLYSRVTAI